MTTTLPATWTLLVARQTGHCVPIAHEILPRQEAKPATTSADPRHDAKHPLQTQKVPTELHDKCFNCLSYSH
jgi:hypothetical protein